MWNLTEYWTRYHVQRHSGQYRQVVMRALFFTGQLIQSNEERGSYIESLNDGTCKPIILVHLANASIL